MQVLLTFDYELFFGSNSGSVEKCILEPTNSLLDFCRKQNISMTFFIDVGYLLKLEEYAPKFPQLAHDLSRVKLQIHEMIDLGCSVQLHIHPHWEKSVHDGTKWHIMTDGCYKLSDFPQEEMETIVRKYYQYLAQLTQQKVHSFRAGGWCIQPFSILKNVFIELGIVIDSSVFPGGKFESSHYAFDFTTVPPFSPAYTFDEDVCHEQSTGSFTEYPIASWKYSPLFYWQLYGWGKVNPKQHKMIGDGSFLAQPGRKQAVLTQFTWNHVSSDGFYAGMLKRQAKTYHQKGLEYFVVIGHPKGLTLYALDQLDKFIRQHKNKYTFTSFSQLVCN